jgi:hypothetical protein
MAAVQRKLSIPAVQRKLSIPEFKLNKKLPLSPYKSYNLNINTTYRNTDVETAFFSKAFLFVENYLK